MEIGVNSRRCGGSMFFKYCIFVSFGENVDTDLTISNGNLDPQGNVIKSDCDP